MTIPAIHGGREQAYRSQAAFRGILDALAHPGRIGRVDPPGAAPPPLNPATAAVLCTLADTDTPVFLDHRLASRDAVTAWIRFHTGARLVSNAGEAAFVVIADPEAMAPLSCFRQGTDEHPDRSATVIIQVERFTSAAPLILEGPGIEGTATLTAEPLPKDFVAQLADNRRQFPRGVDILIAAADSLLGLPRSTRVSARPR